MGLSSLLLSYLGPRSYFHQPSHRALAVPTPGLTGFGAGRGHSSGRRPDAHSSGPSARRSCRWRCRGTPGWASRLQEEVVRGQRGPAFLHYPPPCSLADTTPQGHWGLLSHKSLALKPSPHPGVGCCLVEGSSAVCIRTSRVPGPICCLGLRNPKVRNWVPLIPVPPGLAHSGCLN